MKKLKSFLHEKITEVLGDTLENMAFVSIEESTEEQASEAGQPLLGVNLLITEPVLIEMRLDVSKELLYQVAETMYTMDRDELEDKLINDLLAEILNTLAGRFMTEILPPETSFTLSLPELTDETESLSELKFFYSAEDCPLSVEIKAADPDDLDTLFADLI